MSRDAEDAIREAIVTHIEGATVEVEAGSGAGHYNLTVRAGAFAGKAMVQAHRMIYSALAELMEGESVVVSAIDRLRTLAG